MSFRRALGAITMLAGAGTLTGVAWVVTVRVAAGVQAHAEPLAILQSTTSFGWALGVGVFTLLLGRVIYGGWRDAAPVANVIGDAARTIGVLVAVALGGILIFLLMSGFEPEDTPAAVALGLGVTGGILLAHFGVNLRNNGGGGSGGSGRGYLD